MTTFGFLSAKAARELPFFLFVCGHNKFMNCFFELHNLSLYGLTEYMQIEISNSHFILFACPFCVDETFCVNFIHHATKNKKLRGQDLLLDDSLGFLLVEKHEKLTPKTVKKCIQCVHSLGSAIHTFSIFHRSFSPPPHFFRSFVLFLTRNHAIFYSNWPSIPLSSSRRCGN